MAIFLEGFEYGNSALIQIAELLQTVSDGGDLDLIQATGGFLAVAGNKRHRAAGFQ